MHFETGSVGTIKDKSSNVKFYVNKPITGALKLSSS